MRVAILSPQLCLALLLALSACTSKTKILPDELLIQSEVALYQIRSLNPTLDSGYPPFFLCVGKETEHQDPSPDVLEKVRDSYEWVSPVSDGVPAENRKINEKESGRAGVLLWVGPVKWEGRDSAVVLCGYSQGFFAGAETRFRVRKTGNRWKVADQTELWIR